MKTGVIILAAGAATRMKRPKMLLPFGDTFILSHLLEEVKKIEPESIVLVTGKYHTEITNALEEPSLAFIHNQNWQDGMAGSIGLGIAFLQKTQPDNCIIMVSDQPFLDHNLLQTLLRMREQTGKGIVAAFYEGIPGTPVLFDAKYFGELQQLKGDYGAKAILQRNPQDLATVDFPLGSMDIDTPADYAAFCQKTGQKNVD
jgi:molybdenum cofactor cytidylyltransferase